MTEPVDPQTVLDAITGYWVSQAIYVAAKLGIADRLEAGPCDADCLARATGVAPDALFRLLRALAGHGVFVELEPRRFALTPSAEFLRASHPASLRPVSLLVGDLQFEAWSDLLYSVRTGQCAYEKQSGRPFFDMLEDNAEGAATFNAAMASFLQDIPALVVGAYDFSACKRVVDVGGGTGALLSAILRANPQAHGVLCDLPNVVESARAPLEQAGLGARCELAGCNFFEAVPKGGNVYLLSTVLHDWDDQRSLQILKTCRAAMPEGARLLVVELVIEPGNAPFFGKWLDLHMLVMHGGRDRTLSEYQRLLESAGFALRRSIPTRFLRSVIEAEPR